MSASAIVVGPAAISGPGVVDRALADVALECIDDVLALIDDRVVPVDDLWREVLTASAGGSCAEILLILPSWWSNSRVARVVSAADQLAADVVVFRRSEMATSAPAVVELAAELVVVHAAGQRHVIARVGAPTAVVAAVVACVDGLAAVTIDVPGGFALLGAELAGALGRRGVDVTVVDDRTLVDAVVQSRGEGRGEAAAVRRRLTPRAAAVAVAILSASALATTALRLEAGQQTAPAVSWLVEGRVAVEVPAQWAVERITSGPGSARVQVVSTTNEADAIHVTQSRLPGPQTLDSAAEALRAALAGEPEGIFVDFTAIGERADRAAITYREIRAERHIEWTVLLDGEVRIAIGCQGSVGRPGPEQLCDRAIRSAHAVARK